MIQAFISLLLWQGAQAFDKPVPLPDIKEGEYAVYDGGKYRKFKVFDENGLTYSADCKTKNMKCGAVIASYKRVDAIQNPLAGVSPASQLCGQLQGKNLIAFNRKKDEYNFCQFEDGSMVNSWSLYYKIFPKSQSK